MKQLQKFKVFRRTAAASISGSHTYAQASAARSFSHVMTGVARAVCSLLGACSFQLTATLGLSPSSELSSPLELVVWQSSQPVTARYMGCCGSKAAPAAQYPLDGSGICHKRQYPIYASPTGLQVLAVVFWLLRVLHSEYAIV